MSKNIYKNEKLSIKTSNLLIRVIKYVFLYSLIIIFLFIISIILIKGYIYITTTNLFELKKIDIKGNNYLSKKYILKYIGIKNGMNIFDINLLEIKNKLKKNKWIRDVSIRRVIPHKIEIDITERQPQFILKKYGRLYYIDKYGDIISNVEGNRIISMPILSSDDLIYNKKIYYLLKENVLPVSFNALGWIHIGDLYVKFFDYKNKILWILDKNCFEESAHTSKIIFRKLIDTGDISKIERVIVIGDMGWAKFKQYKK